MSNGLCANGALAAAARQAAAPSLDTPTPEQISAAVACLSGPWADLRGRHKRHEGYRGLVGGLLRAGMPWEGAEAVVSALATATEDEELDKRLALVGDTAQRLREGKTTQGWPTLIDLLGDSVVASFKEALGVEGKRIAATYDYCDEAGVIRFQTVRYAPKDFKQRHPKVDRPRRDHPEDWVWNLDSVPRLLYRLPELLASDPARTVFIPEGEKDVDNLRALGSVATTNPMGAGKWRPEFCEALRGRHVVILPDNDEKGSDHARTVAKSLVGVAASVKALQLPGLPPAGDVSDWLAADGSVEELTRLAAAAPVWQESGDRAVSPEPALPPTPTDPPWPGPLPEEAYYGLAGEIVRTIEPASEADPAGLLFQILIGFGNVIGRTAHFRAEADFHYLNEFLVMVGKTSKGRKGTSWGHCHSVLCDAEEAWARDRIEMGLSSGQGLIWAVRDPIRKQERVKERGEPVRYEEVEADPGVADKRLLVFEAEFGRVLRQVDQPGNILSAVMRQAWEAGDLRSLTKHDPGRATGAHISVIGHVTADELRRYLSTTEIANGFGNRHLFACVQRSKVLPDGGAIDEERMKGLQDRLAAAIAFARSAGELRRDSEARTVWHAVYEELSDGKPGMAGALLARGEAHVMRLACMYAVLDQSKAVRADHLLAALALWQYVEQSVRHVFGECLGDPVADEVLRLLRGSPEGLTRNDLMNYFGRHQSSDRIGRALAILVQHRLARQERHSTGGRPAERWFAGASARGPAG